MAIAFFITLGIAPGVLRLRVRTDGHALVPPDAPEIGADQAIRERFGLDDPVVVFVKTAHERGIFNTGTLAYVDRLTTAFSNLEGVRAASVFSLATEHSDQVFPGTLRFRRYLDPVPQTSKDLDKLRTGLLDIRLYDGNLISKDEKSTAVMVGVPPGVDRGQFLQRVRSTVNEVGETPESIEILGAPVAEALLGTHILEDLGVPTSLLGTRLEKGEVETEWPPRSLHEARRLLGKFVGLVPLAIAIMGLVFALRFRSVEAAALPLVEVGACLLVVFGLMGWLGIPLHLTTTVMPVILTATGITDEIHVFSRYRENLKSSGGSDQVAVLRSTMDEMVRPVVMASGTTAVGFLSFAASSIVPVRAFGFLTAFGILFCMVWSLSVIPACLTLVPARRFVGRPNPLGPKRSRGWSVFEWLGAAVGRYRWAVLVGAVTLACVAPLGIRKIVVQDSWIDGFAAESGFRRATDGFNEQFLGAHILQICVDAGHEVIRGEIGREGFDGRWIKLPMTAVGDPERLVGRHLRLTRIDDEVVGPPSRSEELRRRWSTWVQTATPQGDRILIGGDPRNGSPGFALRVAEGARVQYEFYTSPLLKPVMVDRIAGLEEFIRGRTEEAVGGVLGTADYVTTINYMSRGRKEADRTIPDNADRMEWLWGEYERIRGVDRRRQLVDDDFGRSIVTVLMKNANFVGTARLMGAIRDYETRELRPHGISLSFAGDVAVSQTLIDAIVGTQVVSVIGSLLGDLLVTIVLGRSLVFGLLCILPSGLAILLNFAVMGWMGMPLGVATSMFSAMTLGIGVDYAIHLLERRRVLQATGHDRDRATAEAVRGVGSAIFVDTLAVCLGFGMLMLSQVPANARLGGLLVLSLTTCFLATILILPALLSVGRGRSATVSLESSSLA